MTYCAKITIMNIIRRKLSNDNMSISMLSEVGWGWLLRFPRFELDPFPELRAIF